jgi:hypothetical protein
MVVAQRLRKGACGSPRGAAWLVADALATSARLRDPVSGARTLLRADLAFYRHATVAAALRAGADVSLTVRMNPRVKAAIAAIGDDAWTTIRYTDAVYDEAAERWISRAEVAEIPFTAFTPRRPPSRSRVAWSCAVSPTSTRPATIRRHCSILALPRLLHHHRPQRAGHGGRGQNPPRPRDHRSRPRRPEELGTRTPAGREVRQR